MFKYSEMEFRFGAIINGIWLNEPHHCRVYHLPQWAERGGVKNIYMNLKMFDPMEKALLNLKKRDLLHELKTWNGVYNVRKVRGDDTRWSTHSWATSLDINAATNPLGGPIAMSKEFVQCWKDAGFYWGGEYKRVDGMHYSLVDESA